MAAEILLSGRAVAEIDDAMVLCPECSGAGGSLRTTNIVVSPTRNASPIPASLSKWCIATGSESLQIFTNPESGCA